MSQIILILKDINFIEDDYDFFAPIPDFLQEGAFTLGEGAISWGDE